MLKENPDEFNESQDIATDLRNCNTSGLIDETSCSSLLEQFLSTSFGEVSAVATSNNQDLDIIFKEIDDFKISHGI